MKLYSADFYGLKEFRNVFTSGLWIGGSTSGWNLSRCEIWDARSWHIAKDGSHLGLNAECSLSIFISNTYPPGSARARADNGLQRTVLRRVTALDA